MSPRHVLLAVLVAAIWGFNFVVLKIGLDEFPPILFSALRFLAAAVPAIFFIGRPSVAWRWVISVGLVLGVAKFSFLFIGLKAGIPAGLSSLVLQSQVIFTAVFAAVVLRERPKPVQITGIALALAGIGVIAWDYGLSSPLLGFALIVAAAVCWGVSNVLMRYARPADTLRFMVWVSAVAVLPLFALSALTEDMSALGRLDWAGVGAVGYVAWISTLLGFGIWGFLLRQYESSVVAPFSLLVPVFGMFSAWAFLGEDLTGLQAVAGGLVLVGLAIPQLLGRRAARTEVLPEPLVPAGR
ncbi:O-acetylserine/cysteine efflux transporter [Lentzea albidocapillata subsp. violacea]|uniref:O-acetylserine/cysteine efflux transporter n=1 Tax=Lentzea albidocapillata subsp. violacea TaxID=128104 RepID=A0A1G9VRC1_9PSEU|nr:EamA family transporter [Lentzea albidocapillata]SDM74521.1 O-acetylserine/cysteine efflux transporter [Lentzea albidocapillata subsp. violacea]